MYVRTSSPISSTWTVGRPVSFYRYQPRHWRNRGLGLTTQQIGGLTSGSLLGVAGIVAAINPIAGAAIAAVGAIAAPIISMFSGCGQTCVQATQYANQAAAALNQIVATYQAQPVHYASVQAATLAQIKQIFDALNQACGNPALGSAGQRCISERLVRGGSAPWCPQPNHVGCDWYTNYWDPIANDAAVVPDPVANTSAVSSWVASSLSSLGFSPSSTFLGVPLRALELPALLVVIGLFL